MIVRLALAVGAALLLGGCGGAMSMTPYQPLGLTGGLTIEPGADGTLLIRAVGNGYTPQAAMDDYVMLRAAELTLERGHRCFEIVSRGSQMNDVAVTSAYGTFEHEAPSGRARIRILEGVAVCGEGDAAALVARLRPRVENRSVYFQKN